MSENRRSVHVRFTAEEWNQFAQEAVKRGRLSMGQTVATLALDGLSQLQKSESEAEPMTSHATGGGELKHG